MLKSILHKLYCILDEIYASPFAILGSIGVVANSWNITERLEREGGSQSYAVPPTCIT